MLKIWKAEGDYKQRYKKTDLKRIRAWAHLSKITVEEVLASGEEVYDPVLGEAYEFPCILVYQ